MSFKRLLESRKLTKALYIVNIQVHDCLQFGKCASLHRLIDSLLFLFVCFLFPFLPHFLSSLVTLSNP